ncbi:MAG TPA: hypothetical protein VNJ71_10305 [Gemmatimonadales bacterium]|jgi:hypothetical protein|nr:hypothetical protein [Gemmatimonadales bacterium]
MGYIAILTRPDRAVLKIVGSDERLSEAVPPPAPEPGGAGWDVAVERQVPDPGVLETRLQELLASSRVPESASLYECPLPLAVRALELAVESLWPSRRLQCPECHQYFALPWDERRRMYLRCPLCRSVMLNPGWDTA